MAYPRKEVSGSPDRVEFRSGSEVMESGFGNEPTPEPQPIEGVTEKFCLHDLEKV
jgi:hypothetical protein